MGSRNNIHESQQFPLSKICYEALSLYLQIKILKHSFLSVLPTGTFCLIFLSVEIARLILRPLKQEQRPNSKITTMNFTQIILRARSRLFSGLYSVIFILGQLSKMRVRLRHSYKWCKTKALKQNRIKSHATDSRLKRLRDGIWSPVFPQLCQF